MSTRENMNRLISVIVPVYNVENYLEKCVSSLLNQKYKNLEIILVDDGSTDSSPLLCENFSKRDSRIKVIHQENGGLADARNTGLSVANGEYIAFVDSDDWIDKNAYWDMMNTISMSLDIDIVCCAAERIKNEMIGTKCFSYFPTGTIRTGKEITKNILLDKIGSQVWIGLYRKTCWRNIRFPVGRLYEDIPTTYKVFANADKVAYIDVPYYKYRINQAGISKTPNPIKSYHIYLGFKEHFNYAQIKYPEIANSCCALAAGFAISTYFHYCSEGYKELEPALNDVVQFLDENREIILCSTEFSKSHKTALKIYFFSKLLFKSLCKLFRFFKLQNLLGFDVK